MNFTSGGYEIEKPKNYGSDGTVEKAISIGFEDAMEDKKRECDYEFTIEERKGKKYIHCEVKLDNGYEVQYKHPAGETPDLSEIERQSYKFMIERL